MTDRTRGNNSLDHAQLSVDYSIIFVIILVKRSD